MKLKICAFILILGLSSFGRSQEVQESTLSCADKASYPVHLTFDDGPKIPETAQILDILKRNNIKATFFISTAHFKGLLNDKSPSVKSELVALIARMKAEGHTVGTHAFEHLEHANSAKVTKDDALENLRKNDEVAKKLKIASPTPFRFPYGNGWFQDPDIANQAQVDFVMKAVHSKGYRPMHWDIDSWDWSKIKRKALPNSVLRQICSHEGGIVLMHDIQSFTAKNLQSIVNSIRNSGHKFVSYENILKINSAREESAKFVSLANKAAGIFTCGRSVSELDQVWPSCDSYIKNSSDVKAKSYGGAQ